MADTEDVSYVLLEFITGMDSIAPSLKQNPGKESIWQVDMNRLREHLEWLSEDQRIGIEDARKLLYRSKHL